MRALGPARLLVTSVATAAGGACLVLAVAASCQAAERVDRAWQAIAKVEEGYTDNVRWDDDGPDKKDAFFTALEGLLDWNNERTAYLPSEAAAGVRGRVYYGFSDRNFVELFTRLARDIGRNTLLMNYAYTPERLVLRDDVDGNDDVHSSEHHFEAGVERKLDREKRLRVRMTFEGEWEDADDDARDAFTPTGTAEVRYRVHELFFPRFGVNYGERDAKDENLDREELEIEAGFDSTFHDVALGVRYKRIMRDYTVSSPSDVSGTNGNFGREDDADQIELRLGVPITAIEGLTVEAGYKFRDNQSTRDGRGFEVNEARMGLTYAFP